MVASLVVAKVDMMVEMLVHWMVVNLDAKKAVDSVNMTVLLSDL